MVLITVRTFLLVASMCGVMIALATGLVEHSPGASIIGAKRYGYPLVWRIVMISLVTSVDFWFLNLAIDMLFWTFVSSLALLFIQKVVWPKFGGGVEARALVVPLVLLLPLGLIMDFVHEFGHAMWGIAAGGSLKYMQIAFLVVYPRFAITPLFRLGYVEVLGLSTPVSHGLFLLGGSLTTTIVAWGLAGLLWQTRVGEKTHVALTLLGLFGLLDLPLYVILPQIGLPHWVFIGGTVPEPLNGARALGIPDSVFYAAVLLSTVGLTLRYYPPLQRRLHQQLKKLHTHIRHVTTRSVAAKTGTRVCVTRFQIVAAYKFVDSNPTNRLMPALEKLCDVILFILVAVLVLEGCIMRVYRQKRASLPLPPLACYYAHAFQLIQ